MANIASILKAEISRVARKEVRSEIQQLRKTASQQRSSIAALRRQLDALGKQIRAGAKHRAIAPASDEQEPVRHRFRVQGLITHRKKLGLSAEEYGKLVGVTGQSIYKWESGNARPRAKQLEALAAIRGMGKRQSHQRLEELDAADSATPARRRAGTTQAKPQAVRRRRAA